MGQNHRRFTNEQIRIQFGACVHGQIKRIDIQEALAIGKSRFCGLRREDQRAPPQAAEGPAVGPARLAGRSWRDSPRTYSPGSRLRSRVFGGTSWAWVYLRGLSEVGGHKLVAWAWTWGVEPSREWLVGRIPRPEPESCHSPS